MSAAGTSRVGTQSCVGSPLACAHLRVCVCACVCVCVCVCVCREHSKLLELQAAAKANNKGKWQTVGEGSKPIRDITWNVENLQQFVDKSHGKEFDGEAASPVLVVWSCHLSLVLCLSSCGRACA